MPIAAIIILTIGVPLLVVTGLRLHMSLYKRGTFPPKAPVTPSPTHRDDQSTVEESSDNDDYWSLV